MSAGVKALNHDSVEACPELGESSGGFLNGGTVPVAKGNVVEGIGSLTKSPRSRTDISFRVLSFGKSCRFRVK